MKKTTLILLSPLCLLHANSDRLTTNTVPQIVEKSADATTPWSRDDVIKARDAAYEAREKRSQEIEKATTETVNSEDTELNNTQNKATILNLKPKKNNKQSSIIVEKPKSVEKPKVEGIQLEIIKKSPTLGVEKESIVVVTQVKREATEPKVIKVVAINKTTKIEQDREIERRGEGSTIPDDSPEVNNDIVVEKKPKSPYPTNFIIFKETH